MTARRRTAGFTTGLLAFAVGPLQAQTANDAVLQQWQQQSGQAGAVVPAEEGSRIEWHGTSSLDVYTNSVSGPGGNTLTPLRNGTFERLTLGGDLRRVGSQGDTDYLQAVGIQSNDRSVLSRYAPQLFTLQAGRAGPGYLLSAGDVVASFSSLGATTGLRGFTGARQIDRAVVTGFAGTVAESWESLANSTARDGRPARLTYLRDVYGAKVDVQATPEWLAFGTLQSSKDRASSVRAVPGVVMPDAASTASGTVGARYQTQWANQATLSASAEIGRSRQENLATGAAMTGDAVLLDANARIGAVGLRAGFHRLESTWAAVGQAAPAGVREAYAGADWQFVPEWQVGVDVRTATNQPMLGAVLAARQDLDSLSTRLTWSPSSAPGWSVAWMDTRNRTTDAAGAQMHNDSWQVSVSRWVAPWSASLTAGRSELRAPAYPAGDSRTSLWQGSLGRSWDNATAETPASLTFNLQVFLSSQSQVMALPASNRSRTAGLSGALSGGAWGQLNFNLQLQDIDPRNGTPVLRTRQWTLDYARQLTQRWSMKAFWRDIHYNKGSLLAFQRERVLGLQAGYQW